jgi:hypothetical protein
MAPLRRSHGKKRFGQLSLFVVAFPYLYVRRRVIFESFAITGNLDLKYHSSLYVFSWVRLAMLFRLGSSKTLLSSTESLDAALPLRRVHCDTTVEADFRDSTVPIGMEAIITWRFSDNHMGIP